jgi:tRNA (cytosine38-C5)-methyltransferase
MMMSSSSPRPVADEEDANADNHQDDGSRHHSKNDKKNDNMNPQQRQGTLSSSSSLDSNEDVLLITYLEFYAGIGGWTLALEQAVAAMISSVGTSSQQPIIQLKRLAALDHSDLCVKCFEHNFGPSISSSSTRSAGGGSSKKNKKRRTAGAPTTFNIERLTVQQVEAWKATLWLLSPPCQPHTRQHTNQAQDLDDPRSRSFLHLCHLLQQMQHDTRPSLLFLENVVGFEASASCRQFIQETLLKSGYQWGHFHLNPTQVGIPNDRPRYFCVAIKSTIRTTKDDRSMNQQQASPLMKRYITSTLPCCNHIEDLGVLSPEAVNLLEDVHPISHFMEEKGQSDNNDLRIPSKVLESSKAWCFDIVTPANRRSSCFTSAYGKFVRGTGSVLYEDKQGGDKVDAPALILQRPEEREFDPNWANGHVEDLSNNLRYFSGTEISKLMGFDSDKFSFPADVTLKQQWKLLGNSLNVNVAAKVVELGLRLLLLLLRKKQQEEEKGLIIRYAETKG